MTLFSVMLASCILFPDPPSDEPDPFDTLEDNYFYARDLTANASKPPYYGFYKVNAERLYDEGKCEIWAEVDSGVTLEEAENIAREYNTNIRSMIVEAFGSTFGDGSDTLDFANWLVDRDDGKLTILLLNIKDGYKVRTDPYVAGYFYSGNFLQKGKNKIGSNIYYSNGRDMIYMDTDPGQQPRQAYATLAHELQHLVNFVTYVWLYEEGSKEESYTDVWVNEGLSAYAEYLYLGEHPEDKCGWLKDERNNIKTGNNFFVWDNYPNSPSAILDDYATVYLFFRWLYLQADTGLQPHIFNDIAHSYYSDYRAVTSVVGKSWETLLRTWLAANYYPKNSYGYTGDPKLQEIIDIVPIYTNGNRFPLYPGEGVYSIIENPYSVVINAGSNIRYAGLTAHTATVDVSSPYSGDALLTFNANTDNGAGRENGSLTGVSSVSASRTAAENSRSGAWNGPYVIDAQDLLGRNKDMPIRVRR
jgi:hypothetical protein